MLVASQISAFKFSLLLMHSIIYLQLTNSYFNCLNFFFKKIKKKKKKKEN